MSLIRKSKLTWPQKFGANIICQGPVPKHIGLILDGNRRFAKKLGVETIEGHREGFGKLMKAIRMCRDIGVSELTAYAFSIENFKRSKEEVEDLFNLMEIELTTLFGEKEILKEDGISFQIIGDWSLIPSHVMKIGSKLMVATRYNEIIKVNIAIAYTSRNEMARGVKSVHDGIKHGELLLNDLDTDLLTQTFSISQSHPLDLLVRTSGEARLSDFLLWQSSESTLCFVDVLWPQFSFWNLMNITLQYQKHYFSKHKLKLLKQPSNNDKDSLIRQRNFIDKMRKEKWNWLENYNSNNL